MGKQRDWISSKLSEGQNQRCGQVKRHHLIIFVLLEEPQQNGKERDRGLSEKGWEGCAFTGEAEDFSFIVITTWQEDTALEHLGFFTMTLPSPSQKDPSFSAHRGSGSLHEVVTVGISGIKSFLIFSRTCYLFISFFLPPFLGRSSTLSLLPMQLPSSGSGCLPTQAWWALLDA